MRLPQSICRLPLTSYALALALALGTSVAQLEAQVSTDVIDACLNATNGNVRIVGATESCRQHEVRVQWNVEGLQGETGPEGPPGEDGEDGAEGPTGPSGTTGQDAMSVRSTDPLVLAAPGPAVDIPGLALAIDVPSTDSALVLSTDGRVFATPGAANEGVLVDIVLVVDGQPQVKRRLNVVTFRFQGLANWAISTSLTGLSVGEHTVKVSAQLVARTVATQQAVVGGSETNEVRSTLTAVVTNK